MENTQRVKLNQNGKKYIILMVLVYLINMLIITLSAGKFGRIWMYYVVYLLNMSGIFILWGKDPELINHRGEPKKDAKSWDRKVLAIYNLCLIIAIPIICGLDIRFGWSSLSIWFIIPGLIIALIAIILGNSAILINKYFEATVRIQEDRNHTVISSGPYKIIRHPGYLGAILYCISIPMIIGSLWAFIPAAVGSVAMVLRTSLEDKTLRKELEGYEDFAKKTRYRLFPGLW